MSDSADNPANPYEAARELADIISAFRQEVMGSFLDAIVKEGNAMIASDFDPTRGARGRGAWWADGGET